MTFEDFYQDALKKPPFDIPSNPRGFPFRRPEDGASCQSALMPILKLIASQVTTIIETGCREGYSTASFLKGLERLGGHGQLVSIDFQRHPIVDFFESVPLPARWQFVQANVFNCNFPEVDYIHIDDLHTAGQIKKELEKFGNKAKRFLSFHDTFSQGEFSLDHPGEEGISREIREWTAKAGFHAIYQCDFNHGLWIYERV